MHVGMLRVISWLSILLFFLVSDVRADAISDLTNAIIAALKGAVNCGGCRALLLPLQALAHTGNDAFINVLVSVCTATGMEDKDVCQGAIGEQGPILAHDLRSISVSKRTAGMLCESVFGLCPSPSPMAFTPSFPKPAPANPAPFPSSGDTPFKVVHFSDVHIDRQYTVGSNANCTMPICCRNFADSPPANSITDPAQPFGNPRCDSPGVLAGSMLDAVRTIGADFAIFTGDVVEGAVWLVTQDEVSSDLMQWNSQMSDAVGMPVYGAIGNHDAAPVNSFPRSSTSTSFSEQWAYDIQSAGWKLWINETAADQLSSTSGNYAVDIPGRNLKLIVINTNYWYKSKYASHDPITLRRHNGMFMNFFFSFWMYDSDKFQPDPNGVLTFLIGELQSAEDAGQRAWISGHMPAGKADTFNDQSNYFDQVIQRYKNTIAGIFYGHSHKDEFEIGYSNYASQSEATADFIAQVAPALTPTSGSPAFKVYDIDPSSFEVMDVTVIFANDSSPTFQTNPTWSTLYSARSLYGPLAGGLTPTTSLNGAFWHRLTTVFESQDTVFQQYNAFKSRNLVGEVAACTGDCKTQAICALRALRAENNCNVVKPGLNFKKRDVQEDALRAHVDECHGSNFAEIMQKFSRLTADDLLTVERVIDDTLRMQ